MNTNTSTAHVTDDWLVKVPAITLSFWIIKLLCTTVGATAADYLAVASGWGQATTRVVMALLLFGALTTQPRKRPSTPWGYWPTIVFSIIIGTHIQELFTHT